MQERLAKERSRGSGNAGDELDKRAAELDDDLVPETGRVLTVTPAAYLLMKKSKDILMETETGADMRIKGMIGNLDGAMMVKIAASRLLSSFGFMLSHKSACCAPTQLEDYNMHNNLPGINGVLVEGVSYMMHTCLRIRRMASITRLFLHNGGREEIDQEAKAAVKKKGNGGNMAKGPGQENNYENADGEIKYYDMLYNFASVVTKANEQSFEGLTPKQIAGTLRQSVAAFCQLCMVDAITGEQEKPQGHKEEPTTLGQEGSPSLAISSALTGTVGAYARHAIPRY